MQNTVACDWIHCSLRLVHRSLRLVHQLATGLTNYCSYLLLPPNINAKSSCGIFSARAKCCRINLCKRHRFAIAISKCYLLMNSSLCKLPADPCDCSLKPSAEYLNTTSLPLAFLHLLISSCEYKTLSFQLIYATSFCNCQLQIPTAALQLIFFVPARASSKLLEWRLLIDSSTVLIIATANRFVNSNLRIFFFNRFLQQAPQFLFQLVHLFSLALETGCRRFSWFIMLQLIQFGLRLITNS
ncbi:hypothetical protein F511_36356 [Dorcoceras hygrometricum]|uniref:Uncharacterized protein n=1 Tax=Dorcoceras hygrometricum TaxID=472368 RepID=A0A2Z7AZL0_9LAMI|nr:hypothetical protein F511_36356 [Dorcoceras hygrometricum]